MRAMEKYKICPTCGAKNPPTILECLSCETDLTGVPIGERMASVSDTNHIPIPEVTPGCEDGKMIRLCECGAKNPPSARKCAVCGEDISDIMPTQDTTLTLVGDPIRYCFSSLDDEYAYVFQSNLTVIGRENAMSEYLKDKSFVSRKHAEILIETDKLWIKNYSHTNGTYVNNYLIKDDEYTELHDGDVVGLGGNEKNGKKQDDAAYFRVRIGSCI